MARNRDPFALALETLLRRAAAGAFHPERVIVIQDEARRLGLSTTPVREALAWLCGAGLVQRAAPGGYLGARLDLQGLRGRYALRLQYLQLSLDAAKTVPHGGWAETPQGGGSGATAVFKHMMQRSGDEVLRGAFQRLELQLEPLTASETRVLPDLQAEAESLAHHLAQGDSTALAAAVTLYHQRRIDHALPLLLDLESRALQVAAQARTADP